MMAIAEMLEVHGEVLHVDSWSSHGMEENAVSAVDLGNHLPKDIVIHVLQSQVDLVQDRAGIFLDHN